ncbi:MAG: 3-phosphoglycerate dehydrogenase [Saprospiraceae bacterium]|nr:3-phosphoglycerate dehydrogenase [Candidatus Vicinibacter proximus]
MSWKILINDGMEESGVNALKSLGFEVDTQKIPQEELSQKLQDYQGIIVRSATKVRKELIDICPGLKFIARGGVGMDNIDVSHAREKGIAVINTPAASSRSVAELAMAHLLSITRGLQDSNRQFSGGDQFSALKKKWSSCSELQGKTLLLLGFGRIGSELAKMATAMGMTVIVNDPYVEKAILKIKLGTQEVEIQLQMVTREVGLPLADYVSLHAPFTGSALLGKDEFAIMKKGCFVVNTSRGENIDEEALLHALDSGIVSAAGLDVFQNEPHIKEALIHHPKICTSAHIGASTLEAQERIAGELVDKINALFHSNN